MLRALVWTLRQRRYAALAVTGLFVALICVGAGTFEIHRFQMKRHDNAALRANAHAPVTTLTSVGVPVSGQPSAPEAAAIRYRRVTVTGEYLADRQLYVTDQIQGGQQGFDVLTPLRAPGGTLLVVRGFVAATAAETPPRHVAAPPPGQVHVSGWLQTPQTSPDRYGQLAHREITSINPIEQAARLGAPVYQTYLTLAVGAPGTAGVRAVPPPGLSNPTGGAEEWQLLSYVVQWYALAVLALAMPFVMSRAEVREARRRFLGVDPSAAQLDAEPVRRAVGAPGESGAELVARSRGELAERARQDRALARAVRLADRYGRSLGPDPEQALTAPRVDTDAGVIGPAVRDSSARPHRSADEYHASYNDYLWQLSLADGVPDVLAADDVQPRRRIPQAADSADDPSHDGDAPVP